MNAEHRETVSVTVRRPVNDHGTATVEVGPSNETRHLVEWEDDRLAATFARLPGGSTVPVTMEPCGSRGNLWRVTGLGHGPDGFDGRSPAESGVR